MSKVICICPTHRDHRELAALANGHTFLHHDYASAMEDLSVDECSSNVSISDPEQEIETILRRCRAEHIQGVIADGREQMPKIVVSYPLHSDLYGGVRHAVLTLEDQHDRGGRRFSQSFGTQLCEHLF